VSQQHARWNVRAALCHAPVSAPSLISSHVGTQPNCPGSAPRCGCAALHRYVRGMSMHVHSMRVARTPSNGVHSLIKHTIQSPPQVCAPRCGRPPAHSMHTVCTLCVHCMYTVCTLCVHCVYTVCTLYVHCMYTACTLYAHCMYTVCTLYVHCMYTVCTLHVHCMYTVCALYVRLRTVCAL
jgi:hypothetical protein